MDRLFSHPPVPSPPDYTADVPILMYHHVVEEVTDGSDAMAVSQEALDRQLRLLAEEGFHAVTAQELIDWLSSRCLLPLTTDITAIIPWPAPFWRSMG